MAIIIPNDERGYRLIGITDKEIRDEFYDRRVDKRLFPHFAPNYYFLIDKWCMLDPRLGTFFEALEAVSPRWARHVKGALILRVFRRFMIVELYPQQYNGGFQDLTFAASFSYFRAYIQRIIKTLNIAYNANLPYMDMKMDKKKLLQLSKLFGHHFTPLAPVKLADRERLIKSHKAKGYKIVTRANDTKPKKVRE